MAFVDLVVGADQLPATFFFLSLPCGNLPVQHQQAQMQITLVFAYNSVLHFSFTAQRSIVSQPFGLGRHLLV